MIPAHPDAPSIYPGISQGKLLACRVFNAFSVLYFVGMIIASVALGLHYGHGSGFGDGRTVPSCLTPGGPYYPKNYPADAPRCEPGLKFPRELNGQ
jgi:hypothetical protein